MAFYDRSEADQYEALSFSSRHCRNCGQTSQHLEDGWCPRCNGDDTEADVRSANLKAWDKVRRDHPEWFR